jgi:hypothetical protein
MRSTILIFPINWFYLFEEKIKIFSANVNQKFLDALISELDNT